MASKAELAYFTDLLEARYKIGLPAPTQKQMEFDVDKVTQTIIFEIVAALRDWKAAATRRLHSVVDASIELVSWSDLERWVGYHGAEDWSSGTGGRRVSPVDAITQCIKLNPPGSVTVLGRRITPGGQKVLFEAEYRTPLGPVAGGPLGARVILKQMKEDDQGALATQREQLAHPLNIDHHNIVKVFVEFNSEGSPFVIEAFIPEVLGDTWRSRGLEESVTLIHDIAGGLKFLHEARGIAHLDVKPDNIGRREGNFLLFDFGVARYISDFEQPFEPTGSLRTRAPEALRLDASSLDPKKIDAWALGATAWFGETGRYPFFDPVEDRVPEVGMPDDRAEFLVELRERTKAYGDWISRDALRVPKLWEVFKGLLDPDPATRWDPSTAIEAVQDRFAMFIHVPDAGFSVSTADEVEQFLAVLPRAAGRLLPQHDVSALLSRVSELRRQAPLLTGKLDAIESRLRT